MFVLISDGSPCTFDRPAHRLQWPWLELHTQLAVRTPHCRALGRRSAPDLLVREDPGSENSLHMRSAVLRMRSVSSDHGSLPTSRSGAWGPPSLSWSLGWVGPVQYRSLGGAPIQLQSSVDPSWNQLGEPIRLLRFLQRSPKDTGPPQELERSLSSLGIKQC